jgi:predicted outer membrane repeat protein
MNFKKLFSLLMISFSITVLSCDSSFDDIYDMFGEKPFIFVTPTGAGKMDGSSWENAYGNIQTAINNALPDQEIWVAKGPYTITTALTISKKISMYGGFDFGDTNRNNRTGKTECKLSANAINVFVFSSGSNGAQINGFAFTKDPAVTNARAIYIDASSPIITNCSFTGLISNSYGAGIAIENSSNPSIQNCTFSNNISTSFGSALTFTGTSSGTIKNCTFENNTPGGSGVGAVCLNDGYFIISDCSFNANKSFQNGGAIYANLSNLVVTNSTFTANFTNDGGNGGAIYYNDSGNARSLSISGCTFGSIITGETAKGNKSYTSTTGGSGGAIYINATNIGSLTTISSSKFGYNKSGQGGALYLNCTQLTPDHRISYSIFRDNETTGNGGAINSNDNHKLKILNSLFTGNKATGAGSLGGALYKSNDVLSITSSTFAKNSTGNSSNDAGESIYTGGNSNIYNSIVWDNSTTRNSYSAINNNSVSVHHTYFGKVDSADFRVDAAVSPNIPDHAYINATLDPFVNYNLNDFHLSGVTCKEAGDSMYLNPDGIKLNTDLDGNPRIKGSNTDCGAYEY